MFTFRQILPLFAVAGHASLWTMLLNRVHALPLPELVIRVLEKLLSPLVIGVPFLYGVLALGQGQPWNMPDATGVYVGAWLYAALCCVSLAYVLVTWFRRQVLARPIAALVSNHTVAMSTTAMTDEPLVGTLLTKAFARVPGNQILELRLQEKTLRLPRLPPGLDGLSIAHISDLHFTGKLREPFYQIVIDQVNGLDADLVAVTGDIIDKLPCLSWIPRTLGRLNSRAGVYFVLGNHDKRVLDVAGLRRLLVGCGLTDLGGRCHEIGWNGERLLLAGTELPWFGPAPEVPSADEHAPGGRAFRVLLSHSPDQIRWARRHQFDLMLAGHTHGGQVRFPVIGPVVAPSIYGVRYASGLFDEPPVVMHVSRGIAGTEPLRLNCPPEITKLVLRAPS